jgi:hypothetical protein
LKAPDLVFELGVGTQFASRKNGRRTIARGLQGARIRSRRGKAGLVIALVAIALLTIAPAMTKPIAHHAVFFKALRKPPAASVPWALRARSVTMSADP